MCERRIAVQSMTDQTYRGVSDNRLHLRLILLDSPTSPAVGRKKSRLLRYRVVGCSRMFIIAAH
jgi:hypothetical protein